MKTIAAIFSNMAEAVAALHDLERLGVPSVDISIIAGNEDSRHDEYLAKAKRATARAEPAVISGASLGAGLGIVATLIALGIPGVGQMVVMGPLAMVLAGGGIGAAACGLIAAFHNMGIHHEEAPLYEEAVRRGAIMLMANVDDAVEKESVDVLKRHNGHDIHDEADTWTAAGWPRPDPHPFPTDDSIPRITEMDY